MDNADNRYDHQTVEHLAAGLEAAHNLANRLIISVQANSEHRGAIVSDIANLRKIIQNLEEAVGSLNKVVKGNGSPGLTMVVALMQRDFQSVKEDTTEVRNMIVTLSKKVSDEKKSISRNHFYSKNHFHE